MYLNAHRCFVGFRASFMQTSQRLSSVFFLEVTAKACVGKSTSIPFRAVLHSLAEDTKLGQDFVAARCLPVRDIKGTECKTVVAGCRSIDNAELQPQLSCPPNPTQNALREHQLAQPSYSALLCNALLWASTKHYLSCIILHVMRHSSVGSSRSQV